MPLIPRQDPVTVVASAVRAGRGAPAATSDQYSAISRGHDTELIGLGPVLTGRTAVRSFSPHQPEVHQLSRVVTLAMEHDAWQWPATRHGSAPGLLLAAYGVTGLEPGLYQWNADTADFGTPGKPPWLPDLRDRYSAAPAILLLHDSPLRSGAEGYGGSLVRIGSLGYALWLAARTYGLDACAYGGASPEVTALLRTTAATRRHLFTLAIGYPAA